MIREIAILNSSGDLRLTWDPSSLEEVLRARDEVQHLKAQGYSFFIVDGQAADEVAAGRGELAFRRTDEPLTETPVSDPAPEPGAETNRRRGRPPKAIAIPPMRGG